MLSAAAATIATFRSPSRRSGHSSADSSRAASCREVRPRPWTPGRVRGKDGAPPAAFFFGRTTSNTRSSPTRWPVWFFTGDASNCGRSSSTTDPGQRFMVDRTRLARRPTSGRGCWGLIDSGALPAITPRRMFIGPCREIHPCIACGMDISTGAQEFEWTNPGNLIVFFHRRCGEMYMTLNNGQRGG